MNAKPPFDSPERLARTVHTAVDLRYIQTEFRSVEIPNPDLPSPSYYDGRGTAYVPLNYEDQETNRTHFLKRARTEIERLGAGYDDEWVAEAWNAYWDGTYGMCLKDASPENIVRKNWLIDRIACMLAPLPTNEAGIAELVDAVDALDALERPFCGFDRRFFQRPVSRDTYIDDVRKLLLKTRPATPCV